MTTPTPRTVKQIVEDAIKEQSTKRASELMVELMERGVQLERDLAARDAELARVKAALEFYATEEHYYEACIPLQDDGGNRARRALGLPEIEE
jgi:hypothetical protein